MRVASGLNYWKIDHYLTLDVWKQLGWGWTTIRFYDEIAHITERSQD